MLLGADGDSGQDTGYQDVNLYSTDVSSEVNGTQTISVYFNNKPFVEDMTITVTMIIQKTTIREWYDEYIGGGTVYQLDVRPTSIPDFGSGAGSVTLTVEANTPWALSTNSTWILGITPNSGSGDASVTVVVDANSTTSPRTAYITLRPTTVQIENKTVVLTQAGNSTPSSTLTVSPTSISESSGSSDTTITVTSNTTWTFSYLETTWCTVTLSASNKILVSLTANTDSEQRSTTITVKTTDNAVTRTIPVTQSGTGGGGSLTISPESLTFYAPASEHNVTITTEGSWTVGIPASASWLSVNYESGTGNKTIEVSAIPNSTYDNRQADITIAVGSESKTLHVLQYKNIVWNISSDTVSIGSGGGTTTFDVQSHSGSNSYKYSVFLPDSPSWLSINPSGTEVRGDQTITVTAEPNTDTEPRSAIVRLWNQIGYPQTLEVNVTQAAQGGSSITLSPTIWNVEAGSGTTFQNSITVTAPTGWTASIPSLPGAQDDWCYCLKNSETDLRINVRTNTGEARSCEVVVTSGSDTASVTVNQDEGSSSDGIKFKLVNNCGKEVRLSGKIILNVSRDPNDWTNSTQANANIHGPQVGDSWAYNDIIIPVGESYTATINTIDNVYPDYAGTNFTDGTWYFMNADNGEYGHTVFLYARMWQVSKSKTTGGNHVYVVTPLQNTKLQNNKTYTFTINWFNPEASLAPSTTTDSGTAAKYYVLQENQQTWP